MGEPDLARNITSGTALATADFDRDGAMDLVSGYACAGGSGLVAIHRGDRAAIYASSLPVGETSGGEPFFRDASTVALLATPDFLAAGDCDADGLDDILAGTYGGRALYVLRGDGHGRFAPPVAIALPGRLTAMAAGEVNRADGLLDAVVGVATEAGSSLLVFQCGRGLISAEPEAMSLAADATSIAIGQLDDAFPYDIVVAAGHDVIMVRGSGGLDASRIDASRTTRRQLSQPVSAVAIGDLADDGRARVAALATSGDVFLVDASGTVTAFASGVAPGARLLCANAVAGRGDALVTVGGGSHAVEILSRPGGTAKGTLARETRWADAAPTAVLPMRLNEDAVADIVVLTQSASGPAAIVSSPRMTFTVSNANDSGPGSLRQAIDDANGSPGLDSIGFSFSDSPPDGARRIVLESPVEITDPLTIDFPAALGQLVVDGARDPASGQPMVDEGFVVSAGNSVIRNLAIGGFLHNGIRLTAAGNNKVEGCRIGTYSVGGVVVSNFGNSDNGILIENSSSTNVVGGITDVAGNVIAANGTAGVAILDGTSGNKVQENLIGTDVSGQNGSSDLSNNVGVLIRGSSGNTIGEANFPTSKAQTPRAKRRQTVSNGGSRCIEVFAGNNRTLADGGNIIAGNYIGTSADGTGNLGGQMGNIRLSSSGNTVGGASLGASNIIAFSSGPGVNPVVAGNTVRLNSIRANQHLGIDIGDEDGVTCNGTSFANYPDITSASATGGTITVGGSLQGTAGQSYTVDFYSFTDSSCAVAGCGDTSSDAQGSGYLGSAQVTIQSGGTAAINAALTGTATTGSFVTATATGVDGSTSEFTPSCIPITGSGGLAGAPTNLVATATSPTDLHLSWTDNATVDVVFHIEYREGSGAYPEIDGETAVNVTAIDLENGAPETTYTFRIRARQVGTQNFTGYSNEATVTTPPEDALDGAPTGLSATATSSATAHLAWTDNTTVDVTFSVERRIANASYAVAALPIF